MQQSIDMEAAVRDERGKNAAGRLRRQGKLPAVVYGQGKEAIAVTIDAASITRVLQLPAGHNQILNLKLGREEAPVLASEWQVDPVKGHLLHVDLRRINLKKPVDVSVPIEIVGVSFGVREQGGLQEMVTREVELRALPLKVPAAIPIDVTEMGIGDAVRVQHLAAIEDVTFLSRPDRVLVHVIAPKVVEEETPEEVEEEAAAEGAEPAAEEAKAEEKE